MASTNPALTPAPDPVPEPESSITLEGSRDGYPIALTIHFAAIQELRASANGHEIAAGAICGVLAEDRIAIERCGPAAANDAVIGLFRTQPAGWPAVTDADVQRLRSAMPRATASVLMVVRTLAQRPWSATLFVLNPRQSSTGDAALVEFPFDEYLLRNGWLTELAPPVAPPLRPMGTRAPRRVRWMFALAAVASAGGLAAIYQSHWRQWPPAATPAGVPEPAPAVSSPIALQANRSLEDVEVSWNRRAELVRAAKRGTLVIHNGPVTRMVPVSADQLHIGRIMYHPVSGVDVDFRLELSMPDGRVESESIQVLGFDTAPALTLPVAAHARPKPAPERRALQPVSADRIDTAVVTRTAQPSHTEPQPVRRADPAISREVRDELRNASGHVMIAVLVGIDAAGKVDTAKITGATGEPKSGGTNMRIAALNAARQWRFRPATTDGRAVSSSLTLAFTF